MSQRCSTAFRSGECRGASQWYKFPAIGSVKFSTASPEHLKVHKHRLHTHYFYCTWQINNRRGNTKSLTPVVTVILSVKPNIKLKKKNSERNHFFHFPLHAGLPRVSESLPANVSLTSHQSCPHQAQCPPLVLANLWNKKKGWWERGGCCYAHRE